MWIMQTELLGYHSVCLLSRELKAQYQSLYNRINEYLVDGYAVVYTLESDPAKTLERMKQGGFSDIERFLENGALNILSKESVYSSLSEKDKERTGKELVGEFNSIVSNMKNRSGNSANTKFKGICVMFSADASFELGDFNKHVDFERLMGKHLDMEDVELICFYKIRSLAELGLSTLILLLDYHHYTIHGGWKYREWNPSDTIELIREGLDEVLDGENSELLLRTLDLVYRTDNNRIISQPEVFESNLRKALGDNKADMVVSSITEKIRKELSFG
jgi:MEDS: MEthanogen/methylotroph, DcmR Sensory domain